MRADVRITALAASAMITAFSGEARAIDSDDEHSAPEPVIVPESAAPALEAAPVAAVASDVVVVELGAIAGYMTRPIRGATTPLGGGLGGRLGLEIHGFYIGIRAIDYFGGTDIDVSDHTVLYGTELGYGVRFGKFRGGYFTLRPQVGIGDASISHTDPSLATPVVRPSTRSASVPDMITSASSSSGSSKSTPSDTVTVNNVYVEPAITTMFSSGAHFVAITTSVLVIPGISYGGTEGTTWISYGLHAQVGFRF